MIYYYIECDNCGEETQVLTSSKTKTEPGYCPMCGVDVNAQILDDDEEEDD
jgi:uncharacterized Zn finger protein